MKILIILICVASLGLSSWWYFRPDYRPNWLNQFMPQLPEHSVILYQWKDDSGEYHITDTPPDGREYETKDYPSDTNLMPAPKK